MYGCVRMQSSSLPASRQEAIAAFNIFMQIKAGRAAPSLHQPVFFNSGMLATSRLSYATLEDLLLSVSWQLIDVSAGTAGCSETWPAAATRARTRI